jgi:hypothetical protein
MAEERALTKEELKAKEYVDFYYFWLFHYCGRNYSRELSKRLPLQEEQQREDIAENIYWGHLFSTMFPQFISGFANVDDLFLEGTRAPENAPYTLLQILYKELPIEKDIQRNPDYNYGMEILGTSGAHLSTEGHLRGRVIVSIDLNAPNSVLLYELSKLRDTTFEAFPKYFDAPNIYDLQGGYLHESKVIKQITNASFAVKDDAAKAIGLWDILDGKYAIFHNFAEVWGVISGASVENILIGDEVPLAEPEKGTDEAVLSLIKNKDETRFAPCGWTQVETNTLHTPDGNLFFKVKRKGAKYVWFICSSSDMI